jgi:hypothetical protein
MRQCCGFSALQRFRRSLVILFRFFTSFVSFSVIRLSFSSFYFSSVDSGCVASLPGLGLLFYWEIKFRGVGGFFSELCDHQELGDCNRHCGYFHPAWIGAGFKAPRPNTSVNLILS